MPRQWAGLSAVAVWRYLPQREFAWVCGRWAHWRCADGRLPLPLFCQRVFASEAHVASLEGAKAGAFTADDAAYRWQVHAALRGSQR